MYAPGNIFAIVTFHVLVTTIAAAVEARPDAFSASAATPFSASAEKGLLGNDSGTGLAIVRSTQPRHGALALHPDGSFTYTPGTGFKGSDSFTYTVSDCARAYPVKLPPLGTFGGVSIAGSGFGSSLRAVPGASGDFYGLADRGPNVDGPAEGTKILPLPDFAPSIRRFRLESGVARPVGDPVALRLPDGTPLSCHVNSRGATGERLFDLAGRELPPSPAGFDSEGLAAMPDGTFWVSDEYGPFLAHFDASGRETRRLSPMDGSLPVEFRHRIPNRGMECLAATPDGTLLVGILQSALRQPDAPGLDASKIPIARIVTFAPASGEIREFLYVLDDPASTGVVLCDIAALDEHTFLVIERDGNFPPDAFRRIYRIDLRAATDIGPCATLPGARYESAETARGLLVDGMSLEALVGVVDSHGAMATLERHGIAPAAKTLHLDIGETLRALDPSGRFFAHDKIEGIVAADGGQKLYLSNDSDFGANDTASEHPPYAIRMKSSPATPGVQDTGEILELDLRRLPVKTSTATVTIEVR